MFRDCTSACMAAAFACFRYGLTVLLMMYCGDSLNEFLSVRVFSLKLSLPVVWLQFLKPVIVHPHVIVP